MRKKIQLLLLSIVLTVTGSEAQNIQFSHVYGGNGYDIGYSVVQTADEGYAVAGSSSSSGNGSTDAYLLKTDSLGKVLWKKTVGGINIDQAHSIQETADSGLVMAGFTSSFGNGGFDMYVIRTDKLGDTLWTKTYGGSNWDFAYSIEQTVDSGFVITGGTYSFGNGSEDMYLVKINSVGDTLWTKTYGGIKVEEARAVKQTADGGFVITGFSKSLGDSNGDIYTIKTNNVGDTLWTHRFGGTSEDAAFDIIERISGEFIITGKTSSSGSGGSDGIVLILSPTGTMISNKLYGGTEDDGINSVVESIGGRYGLAGYTYSYGNASGASDFLLYIENPFNGFHSGTFGETNNEVANSINTTKDNGYIICGNSTSYSNLDYIFLVKTDSNGIAPPTAEITITSVPDNSHNHSVFRIFPNPANQWMNLQFYEEALFESNSIVELSIVDVLGRSIYRKMVRAYNLKEAMKINTEVFPSGIYLLNIKVGDYSENRKVIIKH